MLRILTVEDPEADWRARKRFEAYLRHAGLDAEATFFDAAATA